MRKKSTAPKVPKVKKVKPPLNKELFKIKQDFISRNVKSDKINWSVCMKITNQMFEQIDDIEFFKTLKLWEILDNLYWFTRESGMTYLKQQYDKYLKAKNMSILLSKDEKTQYPLTAAKIGEDLKIESGAKPKKLSDFLNE